MTELVPVSITTSYREQFVTAYRCLLANRQAIHCTPSERGVAWAQTRMRREGGRELIDMAGMPGCWESRVRGWRCVCAALPPPRHGMSVFTSTQVEGAGKQTLSAVMFDPEPRARQRSGEGLSGHWDWPQGCGGGGACWFQSRVLNITSGDWGADSSTTDPA